MKIRLFIAAIFLFGVFAFTNTGVAELQEVGSSGIVVLSPSELFQMDDPLSLDEEDVPTTTVPEPATFGLIALALAIGGGLMVRRKND